MRPLRHSLGVTLVEMITAMVVLGIIAAMASGLMGKALQNYRIGTEASADAFKAQLALERMTRELREVRSNRSTTTVVDLTPAAGQIDFVNLASTPLRFSLSGSTLYRSNISTGVQIALADSVSALAFQYLQSDGRTVAAALSPTLVYYITVNFTVASDNITRGFADTVKPAVFSP